jgi:hypothetical protein
MQNQMSEIKRPVKNISREENIKRRLGNIETPQVRSNKKSFSLKNFFGLLIILAILISFIILLVDFGSIKNKEEWQAVFLSDGQVYFGKIVKEDRVNIILNEIYYLQNSENIQQGERPEKQKDISLIKLGTEVHGPTDEMRINKYNVLFVENLRDDSKIVGAIKNYMSNTR